MTILAVIGAAIIYYLQLEWWWWVLIGIAAVMDIDMVVKNNKGIAYIIDSLSKVENKLDEINETLDNGK